MNFRYAVISFFLFPIYAFAAITGTYEAKGYDPDFYHEYIGTVVITESDGIYTVYWTFATSTDVGTGVLKDDSLAVVFQEDNSSSYGVQLYEIHEHGILCGPWVRFGDTAEGHEKLSKIANSPI